jgi:hypothetical protein
VYEGRSSSGNPAGQSPCRGSCQACHARKAIFDGRKPKRRTWKSEKSCSEYGPTFASLLCTSSSSPVGTSSGVISVSRTSVSTAFTSSSNCFDDTTQRIRCWISVFGTPPLTL